MNQFIHIKKRTRAERGRRSDQRGVALLEALFAILIFSMGILALVGLQAASVAQVTEAKYRADASFLANSLIGEMWVNRSALATYEYATGTPPDALGQWIDDIQDTLPGVTEATNLPTIDVSGDEVTITVYWQPPGLSTPRKYIAVAHINDAN